MRANIYETLIPAGFFVMRTPTLPWDEIEKWGQGLSAIRAFAEGRDIESALFADIDLLRVRLRTIVMQPAVKSALYIASPDLFRSLGPWLAGDESKKACGVEPAIVRYLMRMAARATPFGLFAGTTVGTLGKHTSLSVCPIKGHLRHTRIDAEYVFELAEQLSKGPALLPELRFKTTPTAYPADGRLRYYEPCFFKKWRTFRLADVQPTRYLDVALNAARIHSGLTMVEIAHAISSAFEDIHFVDALEYVTSLVEAKLLCHTFSPALTGSDPAIELVEKLRATKGGSSLAIELESTLAALKQTDAVGLEAEPEHYEHLESRLRSIYGKVNSARVFRTDLKKPSLAAVINPAIVNDVLGGIQALAEITEPSDQSAMRRFIREFELRYHESEVPLLQVLDEETGIGFDVDTVSEGAATSLLDGIAFHRSHSNTSDWNTRTGFLFYKLSEALRTGEAEIYLSDTDIEALSTRTTLELPAGLSALVAIAAVSGEAADRGEYRIHLRKISGPNSAKLLGRFCEGDEELREHVEGALRREEAYDPDALHAEIVHLPHTHASNVICRPVLRDYEIPLFDQSGASESRQIALTDLFVSINRGKVILRSARHKRRVVPHLACAHAFRKSGVGLYRFLASLEEQGTFSELSFSWGPLVSAPYLPRVARGKVVLSLAQWNFSASVLKEIDKLEPTEALVALQELRTRLRLPRFVLLADSDFMLPVDFENALSLQSFVKVAKQSATCTLCEVFPPPSELLADGEEGRFQHELVIPFVQKAAVRSAASSSGTPMFLLPYRADRRKFPGSDWLFVKIYCGAAMIDRVLTKVVIPLVAELRAERVIDRWFFVRFADPQWHLRLRLRGEPSRIWKEVAPRLFASIRSARAIVHNVMVDTYDPEEERYGGEEALDIAERVFEADSDAALSIIQIYGADAEARWRLALLGMDVLLNDYRFSLDQKRQVVDAVQFGQVFQYENYNRLKHQLGNRYRKLRPEIEMLFQAPPELYAIGVQAIQVRSQRLVELAARLRQLESSGHLRSSPTTIVGSYLHMWANRIFRNSINAQELVLYEFLHRIYDGQIGRNRANRQKDSLIG